jgi:hypothetical protein
LAIPFARIHDSQTCVLIQRLAYKPTLRKVRNRRKFQSILTGILGFRLRDQFVPSRAKQVDVMCLVLGESFNQLPDRTWVSVKFSAI